jgi:hypothetical protein
VVEPAVALLRQALLHIAHHIAPDFFRHQVAGLHPGNRLNVDGNAFGQPEMRRDESSRARPSSLGKIGLGAVAPDREANCSPAIAESCSPLYSAA